MSVAGSRRLGEAVDKARRAEWSAHGKSKTKGGRWVKETRWALLKAPEKPDRAPGRRPSRGAVGQQAPLRAFLLKEQLRELYHRACRGRRLPRGLARLGAALQAEALHEARAPIRCRREGVIAAARLGLSNGRLEGLNSKVRLISHRSFGFHSAAPLIALVHLCCGGSRSISPSHELVRTEPRKPVETPKTRIELATAIPPRLNEGGKNHGLRPA